MPVNNEKYLPLTILKIYSFGAEKRLCIARAFLVFTQYVFFHIPSYF